MELPEPRPFLRETIEIRGPHIGMPGEMRIAPALVVGEDEDDVGTGFGRGAGWAKHLDAQDRQTDRQE
jgi:hypothetical protein